MQSGCAAAMTRKPLEQLNVSAVLNRWQPKQVWAGLLGLIKKSLIDLNWDNALFTKEA
jgi:hypothetical protein